MADNHFAKASAVPIHPLSSKRKKGLRLIESNSPFLRVKKSFRYLSDWDSDVVKLINQYDHAGNPEDASIDLSAIILPANAPNGHYGQPFSIMLVPHWLDTFKLMINLHLDTIKIGTSNCYGLVRTSLNNNIRFAQWCVINGIYEFADVKPEQMESLASDIREGGWYKALRTEERLVSLIERCEQDYALLAACASCDTSQEIQLNLEAIQAATGLLLHGTYFPRWLRVRFGQMLGVVIEDESKVAGWTEQKGRDSIQVLRDIGMLSKVSADFDGLTFVPLLGERGDYSLRRRGRTENLLADDSIKMMKTALEWVYDYAPGIIALGKELRQELEQCKAGVWQRAYRKERTGGVGVERAKARMRNLLQKLYPHYLEKYNLPFASCPTLYEGTKGKQGQKCYHDFVLTLMTACFQLIGINHGRRKNEIIGEKKPFGCFAGCVTIIDEEMGQFKFNVYIEKTYRDWHTFWCNKLVADAVKVLEQLADIHRPLEEPSYVPDPANPQRHRKLFEYRRLTYTAMDAPSPSSYVYKDDSGLFYELAGVDKSRIDHKTHVFRRFFALVYTYRYDNATLLALQQHLRHLNLDMAQIYTTDPEMRAEADSIALNFALAEEVREAMGEAIEDAARDYLQDKIQEMIEGNPTGGGFTKNVRRVVKIMLQRGDFSVLADSKEQAEFVSQHFDAKGYIPTMTNERGDVVPTTYAHGTCVAGNCERKQRGKCYNETDGNLHREKASISTCRPCMFHINTENHLANQEKRLVELQEIIEDEDGIYTPAEISAAELEMQELQSIIANERNKQHDQAARMKKVQDEIRTQEHQTPEDEA